MNSLRRTLPILLVALLLTVGACANAGPEATLRHSEMLTAQAQFNSAMNTYTGARTHAQNLLAEMGTDSIKGQAAYDALAASDRALAVALTAIKAPSDAADPALVADDLNSAIHATNDVATLEAQFAATPMSGWGPLSAQSAATDSAQAVSLYNLGIDLNSPNVASTGSAASGAPTSLLGGKLIGLIYQNPRWGINATLPSGWTYGPVLVVTYGTLGISGEQVAGTMITDVNGTSVTSHEDFGALLIPGLTQVIFSANMVKPVAGSTWSAVTSLTIDGKAAWRADSISDSGLSHITVVGFAESGQVLILSTPDPSAIAAWVGSIHLGTTS